mgnify:CR=1 FL=1
MRKQPDDEGKAVDRALHEVEMERTTSSPDTIGPDTGQVCPRADAGRSSGDAGAETHILPSSLTHSPFHPDLQARAKAEQ